jgi:tRNA(adenine34) deaminase
MTYIPDHIAWMQMALVEACKAQALGEVPVGAVLVAPDGRLLAAAHNRVITAADPSAHAEILALRAAARIGGNYRLLNTTLYVTIEPCVMCMGALVHARVQRVVFGARDPKWGAAGSLYQLAADDRLNHRIEIVEGILLDDCRALIQDFFRRRRSESKGNRRPPEGD